MYSFTYLLIAKCLPNDEYRRKKTQKCSSLTLHSIDRKYHTLREINFSRLYLVETGYMVCKATIKLYFIGKQHKDFHWDRKKLQLDKNAKGANFPTEPHLGFLMQINPTQSS
jgi:hypothetical protein